MDCNKCYGFLVDFISVPVDDYLKPFIKSKNMIKKVHDLAIEFYRIFNTIELNEQFYVANKMLSSSDYFEWFIYARDFGLVKFSNHNETNKKYYFTEDYVKGMIKLEGLNELKYKDNIDYIIFLLEEYDIIQDKVIQQFWIAICIEHLWNNLQQIHDEHTQICDVTYTGIAIGMKINSTKEFTTQEENDLDSLYN